jgi:hypothetical protein
MITTLEQLRELRRTLRNTREQLHHMRYVLKIALEHLEDGSPQMASLLIQQALNEVTTGDHNGNKDSTSSAV